MYARFSGCPVRQFLSYRLSSCSFTISVSSLILTLLLLALPVNAGAQTAHFSYAQSTLGSGFSNPFGVAVDGSGNVFVADNANSAVKEILAAGGYTTVNTLGSGFTYPRAVAVDGSGNVFVAYGNAVKEILAAGRHHSCLSHDQYAGQRLQRSRWCCGGRERKRLRRRYAATMR